MRPGILAVLTAAALGTVLVAGGGVRAQSFAQAPEAESAPGGAPASAAKPRTTSTKRKDPAGAGAKQAAPKPSDPKASAMGLRGAPSVPARGATNKAGEVDSVNLPGVRESGRRKLGETTVTRPVGMPSLGAGMPTVGSNSSRAADTDSAGRKYPGGGVMTGDVSIGGPLGAGPYGR